jgi:hypothetical protein
MQGMELTAHHSHMPRTALRYAIEHFSPEDRAVFMRKSAEDAQRITL